MPRLGHLLATGLVLVGACAPGDEPTLRWRLRVDPQLEPQVSRLAGEIREGGCDSDRVIWQAFLLDGEVAVSPPPLGEGRFGLAARAQDADCRWIGEGCEEVVLPESDGTHIVTVLEATAVVVSASPAECVEQLPTCGNGSMEAGEDCDDGNRVETDACTSGCIDATCGDGILRAEVEDCDDGNGADDDACTNACRMASCGDGVVWRGREECDDGNAVDTDSCRNDCSIATDCGNGTLDPGEACDDGNREDTDSCRATCQQAVCGDGVVWSAMEECDDGNEVEGDGCTNTCALASCGDGVVYTGVEECDDGNVVDGDACQGDCTLPPVGVCEPGRTVRPATAFDAFPGLGQVCGTANAIVADGLVAGIDRPRSGANILLDGENVTGCLGVDFGAVLTLESFTVRADAVADGCGTACESPCSSDYMRLFVGQRLDEYTVLSGYISLADRPLTDYLVPFGGSARYLVICRGGAGWASADVAVDAVTATCP